MGKKLVARVSLGDNGEGVTEGYLHSDRILRWAWQRLVVAGGHPASSWASWGEVPTGCTGAGIY